MYRPSYLLPAVCLATACFVEVVEPDDELGGSTSTGESGETDDELVCGNGTREPQEQCEGQDLDDQTCESLGFTEGGTLACSPQCTFDTSDCAPQTLCGDGMAQGDEECDGEDLKGRICESFGFAGGTLLCTAECQVDTSECTGRGRGA